MEEETIQQDKMEEVHSVVKITFNKLILTL